MLSGWKERAKELRREVYALYYACRDPRVPWYAKALAVALVGYAFSPIDLIPDFVPVLGYLDDLIIVSAGVLAVRSLIPPQVMEECRARARGMEDRPTSWVAGAIIVALWMAIAVLVILWLVRPGRTS